MAEATYEKRGDEIIRKWMLALGAVLMIVGLILGMLSNYNQKKITSVLVKYTTGERTVSANLQKDDKMVVELRVGSDWATPPFEIAPESSDIGVIYVNLLVLDPQRNITRFWIAYAYNIDQRRLDLWSINVTRNDGGLNTTSLYDKKAETYEGIGGVAMYDGQYVVNVTGTMPPKNAPPSYLGIFKGEIVTEYPFTYFLPLGVVIGASGTITLLMGLRSKKRKIPRKRKSSRFSPRQSMRQR